MLNCSFSHWVKSTKRRLKHAAVLSMALFTPYSFADTATASDTMLSVTPERCVALRKGQTCYLEVDFQWQTPEKGAFCLYNLTLNKKVNCWQAQRSGQYKLDFQATKDHHFSLREQGNIRDLAATKVVVAWVYKSTKRSKSSWRLF